MNAAVFASGSGTNLEALLRREEAGDLDCHIDLVIVDQENAYARQRARQHGVEQHWIRPRDFSNKEEYETRILELLKAHDIQLIILAGYMRYIGQVLLQAYPYQIINIHPAYLPEFPGAHGIADAFDAKASQTGVTVHYVDAGVDTGPVILQERVAIDPKWDLETLEEHVHAKEYDLFYRAVNQAVREIQARS